MYSLILFSLICAWAVIGCLWKMLHELKAEMQSIRPTMEETGGASSGAGDIQALISARVQTEIVQVALRKPPKAQAVMSTSGFQRHKR